MKLLLDMPVSQRTASWLRAEKHDVIHASDLGLAQASDEEILRRAKQEGRVVLTTDLDFPHLLSAMPAAEGPGIILIRLRHPTPQALQQRLEALFRMAAQIDVTRAISVLEENRVRVHRLPVH
ncbi:MAG: DUF5615 family PIN-like protein [Candidatus Omnitrophota bacterium]|nr:DUF5615 family PIN-like protein [Candidatus Omnitrophota bacterium]